MVQSDVRLYQSYYNMGWIFQQQAKFKLAAENYRKAILCCRQMANEQQRIAVDAHHNLGIVLAEQGQWRAATYHYHRAIALNPQLVSAFCNLGIALLQQDEFAAALEIYRRALLVRSVEDPLVDANLYSSLYYGLGQALQREGSLTDAIAAYHEAIERDPQNAKVQYSLALLLQRMGDHPQAITLFQQALRLDSSLIYIEGDCGFSWLALDEFDRAMGCFQRAIAADSALVTAYCEDALSLSMPAGDEMLLAKISFGQFLAELQFYPVGQEVQRGRTALGVEVNAEVNCRNYLAQALVHWGNVLRQYGGHQLRQAALRYQQAIDIYPHRADLYLLLADCWWQYGVPELTMRVYDQLQEQLNQANRGDRCGHSCSYSIEPMEPPIDGDRSELSQQSYSSVTQLLEQRQQWERAIAYYRWQLGSGQLGSGQLGSISPTSPTDLVGEVGENGTSKRLDQPQDSPDLGQVEGVCAEAKICEGLNCSACLKRITHEFEPIELEPGILHLTCRDLSNELDKINPSVQFDPESIDQSINQSVTRILNGRVWIASKENAWKVCNGIAVFDAAGELLPQLSRNYPGELPGCHYPGMLTQIPLTESLPMPKKIQGKVAVLSGLSGDVYFHWMIDILPRLEILRANNINFEEIDWFLINSQEKKFQAETLRAFGIPEGRVLESDRYSYIEADELIVPSFCGDLGWSEGWAIATLRMRFLSQNHQNFILNSIDLGSTLEYNYTYGHTKPKSHEIKARKIEFHRIEAHKVQSYETPSLKTQFIDRHEFDSSQYPLSQYPLSQYPLRIYISRMDAQHRRLLNETEVISVLKSLGFLVLSLDGMSVVEQAKIFSRASFIVAPHGSSLTNLVFCQPRTKILEVVSPNYIRHYFWRISRQLNLDHYVVQGEDFSCAALRQLMYPSPLTEDIWVDIARLERAVRLAL